MRFSHTERQELALAATRAAMTIVPSLVFAGAAAGAGVSPVFAYAATAGLSFAGVFIHDALPVINHAHDRAVRLSGPSEYGLNGIRYPM